MERELLPTQCAQYFLTVHCSVLLNFIFKFPIEGATRSLCFYGLLHLCAWQPPTHSPPAAHFRMHASVTAHRNSSRALADKRCFYWHSESMCIAHVEIVVFFLTND